MQRNIVVEPTFQIPIVKQEIELVERKGIGHPDSIADGIAEAVCRALCRMYKNKYDMILHHNTDETQIVGGQSAPKFKGGVVLEPAYILLVGRATTEVIEKGETTRLPYRSTAIKAARNYLKLTCSHLDVDSDVAIDCRIGKGSVDLRGLYDTKTLKSNDTSFGVGYAPMTDTEIVTLQTEKYINGTLKKVLPEVGEDIKVMSYREGAKIKMTVAAAIIDSETPDLDHYISVKEELTDRLYKNAQKYTDKDIEIVVNAADNYDKKIWYLTVTGLSMENGDDGSVGRGNRVNGLITPCRPMSMEAAAGKNPVTHVGKLYNILSYRISQQIYDEANGDIEEVHTRILSQIGKPIDTPQITSIKLVLGENTRYQKFKTDAESIANEHLENITKLTDMIVEGEIDVF